MKIYFLAKMAEQGRVYSSVFYFVDKNEKSWCSYEIPENYNLDEKEFEDYKCDVRDSVKKIYKCFLENDRNGWYWMNWELSKDGKFSIDFWYEEEGREEYAFPKKEVIWAYEKFGLVPKENSFKRSNIRNLMQLYI